MDEKSWRASQAPDAMLAQVLDTGRASERCMRLFACACGRRIVPYLTDHEGHKALEVAERYADGMASAAELGAAYRAAHDLLQSLDLAVRQSDSLADAFRTGARAQALRVAVRAARQFNMEKAAEEAVAAAVKMEVPSIALRMEGPTTPSRCEEVLVEARSPARCALEGNIIRRERAAQADLLRDIFGPIPFHPVALSHGVRGRGDGMPVQLAQAAYANLRPDGTLDSSRLADLVDGLQGAGCDSLEILAHLRAEVPPHVRGCWAIDLILSLDRLSNKEGTAANSD
jgi:hypothetical protein